MNNKIIELENVKKIYKVDNNDFIALNINNISFEKGKFYAIIGHSGSGKSTLLQIIGLIKDKTNGTYKLFGKNVDEMNNNEKANIRNKNIGFMFQDFYLDEDIKAIENVMLPYYISQKKDYKEKQKSIYQMFNEFNITGKELNYPKCLSTGEKARVSLMRALINNPDIILADEPTGNLDKDNEKMIFEKLKKYASEGKCVIVVSHSSEVSEYADVIIRIEKGIITYE